MLSTDAWIPIIIKNGVRYFSKVKPNQRNPTDLRFPEYKHGVPGFKNKPNQKADMLSFPTRKPPNLDDD